MNDEAFRALSNATRRRGLEVLHECDSPIDLDALPDKSGIYEEPSESFEIVLYHNHLPRLDDTGFIDWDREQGTVVKGPRFDEVRPLLNVDEDSDNPNSLSI
ncbi:DUF7344 domain-containing protein [Natronococcus jeotgali]|uniref:DUF7344 domain-containing protein n=1 Tax=Natronococcus jeotgali DSM 18795 TaxID=1227498 RepID=L9XLV8_9EURY|nr:hypothetical protein [Natronococcus jeotgali]ELY62730.1 hypothetical protein C492_07490 [Natronococcus jeotgali DSM 18795]